MILNNVVCDGSEKSIIQCSRDQYDIYNDICTNNAGVMCEGKDTFNVIFLTCFSHIIVQESCNIDSEIRLTQFSSDTFGRLEMCSSGKWGSVCSRVTTTDNINIANIACQELGHAPRGKVH